jgi:predicted dehydrogenase
MRIGIAGLGFMGMTHAQAWNRIEGAELTAVYSSDEKKLRGDLREVGGNLGISGTQMDFSRVQRCQNLDALLTHSGVDAVDLCLPTHLHARAAILALQSGKHVIVEKPLALNGSEAEQVLEAARKSGKVLMAAHVLRFLPPYRAVADVIRSGQTGAVRSVFLRRRCGAPSWSRWLGDASKSGGGVFDLLIHDVDYAVKLFGIPEFLSATGYTDFGKGIDVIHGQLLYRDGFAVTVTGGWHHPKSYPFSMEFTVVTDGGTFEYSSGAGSVTRYAIDGNESKVELSEQDPFEAELRYFSECCRTGSSPDLCPPSESAAAVKLTLLLSEAREKKGEKVPCSL